MQLRYDTQLNVEEYISTKAWQKATLTVCPNHPKGGCSLVRHGTYVRKCGNGQIAHIARWYCAESHTTFSLLPDCFGARMPGTLQQLEDCALAQEQGQSSLQVARQARPQMEASEDSVHYRWWRRRQTALYAVLTVTLGLLPEVFAGCQPQLLPMRAAMQSEQLLVQLRQRCAGQLNFLPPPLGFGQFHSGLDPL